MTTLTLTLTLKYQSHHYHIAIKWRGGMGTFSYRVQRSAFHARNLKYTAMHQQNYPFPPLQTPGNITEHTQVLDL